MLKNHQQDWDWTLPKIASRKVGRFSNPQHQANLEKNFMSSNAPLLYLHESNLGPDPDDVLDEGYTDANGEFHLQGSERELTNIDPVFKVYHDCDDGIKPGQRKVKFRIPDSYISPGGVAKRVFNIGVLNLETIFAKEERDLL
ncbi:Transthyretin-like family protein [Oesophagostomum dentatum]|uniref:Transthyretin-like family protein n=1 Tax=Oesophagostomum dentatum TaxID=61180 RepID=A0A0B1SU12_OESDE|nr:Transthyretin-like family protein [Oesophagostomum dentatum]